MLKRLRSHPIRRGLAGLGAALMVLFAYPVSAQDAAPKDPPAAGAPRQDAEYRLKPGDEILIFVTPQTEYNDGGEILPDGTLFLKSLGKVRAAGMTVDALLKLYKTELDKELVNPTVSARFKPAPPPVKEPMPPKEPEKPGIVTVTGAVLKPGAVPFEKFLKTDKPDAKPVEQGLRVRRAIDLAGGPDKDADLTKVTILHPNLTSTIVNLSKPELVRDEAHNLLLKDGDSVEIARLPEKSKQVVRIRGEVQKAGEYELGESGMTLLDLIDEAGKLTPLGDPENVQFQRKGEPVQTIDLVEQVRQGLNAKIPLQPGDEIVVPQAGTRVFLLGPLEKPGPKKLKPGWTVKDFFQNSGPDVQAAANPNLVDLTKVQVSRKGKEEPIKINLKDALASNKKDNKNNIVLEDGDLLLLPAKNQKISRSPLDFLGPLAVLFGAF